MEQHGTDMQQGTDSRVFGGRYLIVEQVGSGGMATVYLGRDTRLKRDVAIKVLHPHLASREDARARFNREAQAIARLNHPNIVDVYDYSGGADTEAYLVTEFVRGVTLTAFCEAHGPFLPQAAVLVAHAIAGALKHAHSEKLIHRDIKPDNLMISSDGVLKLMDFGIATAIDLDGMTATGAILGSPAHMAPEQIEGHNADHRVDIFAFGTLLYKLVTNELPFMASNPHALFRLILECQYDPPSRYSAAVGHRFEEILSTCMARNPEDRFTSMAAVVDALDAYLREFQMGEVSKLLPRLLQAPEQFQMEWRPVLVQVLTTEGRSFAKAGSLALAINAYNRALAIDPEASEPKRGLSDLTSRSRRRKRVRAFAAMVATVAVGVGIWVGLQPPPPKPPEPVQPADAIAMAALPKAPAAKHMVKPTPKAMPKPVPAPAKQIVEPDAGSAAPDIKETVDAGIKPRVAARVPVKTRRRPARPPRATPPPTAGGAKRPAAPEPKGLVPFTLSSQPPNATIFLNGKFITNHGTKRLTLEMGRSYTMRCLPSAVCDECPDFKDVRFQVPDNPNKLFKKRVICNFNACCKRSTRLGAP